MNKIKPFQKSKNKMDFVKQYKNAMKIEQVLKQRAASLMAGLKNTSDMLKEVQSGMKMMIQSAEGTVINTKEVLNGQEDMQQQEE